MESAHSRTSVRILGTRVDLLTKDALRAEVARMLSGSRLYTVAKLNSEFLVRASEDREFAACLETSDLNIADGAGLLWAARFLTLGATRLPGLRQVQILLQAAVTLGALVLRPAYCRWPLPERIPGVEALETMLEAATATGSPVFFYGSRPQVNSRAREILAGRHPHLVIAGGCDGYQPEPSTVLGPIEESKARLLVVALGSPKQEYWIRDYGRRLTQVRVAVGEGGSLDFIAGDFRRAPRWMQEKGLEWLWRLFMNEDRTGAKSRPRRIWYSVPRFICRVVGWKLKRGPVAVAGEERVSLQRTNR
jgi:N-acetylglucosaminyldiphosphoundecaprenol N-acetyl-beta-D-mannosaminyltransferase